MAAVELYGTRGTWLVHTCRGSLVRASRCLRNALYSLTSRRAHEKSCGSTASKNDERKSSSGAEVSNLGEVRY